METTLDNLPTYKAPADGSCKCPKCGHYNATLLEWSPVGHIFKCRDCGYTAKPAEMPFK